MTELDRAAIRALPKVELHVHVESCLSEERVEALAREVGVPMLRPRGELYRYRALSDFLATYEWWCDLLRTPDIAEQLAYDSAAYFGEEEIVYAELLTGPRYWTRVPWDELLPALDRGLERAHADGHADVRLVPSISREQSPEWAMELVEWIGAGNAPRVVGLGLDGNEAVLGRTSPKFEAAFARAGELGLGRTAHAGESSGPEGVIDALDCLGLDRVDHGVRAIEDPALLERLAAEGVTLNVCPTSNVITGLYPSVAEHPVGALIAAGVPVTVNSDDPMSMELSLNSELADTAGAFGWGMDELVGVTRTAIDAAFCDAARKDALHGVLDAHVGVASPR
jgi:adenosine deaminase